MEEKDFCCHFFVKCKELHWNIYYQKKLTTKLLFDIIIIYHSFFSSFLSNNSQTR